MNTKTLPSAIAIAAGLFLVVVVPMKAAIIANIDFENNPSLAAQRNTFATAGPLQTYTSPGVYTMTGGVVLGTPTFLAPFLSNGTVPNAYGTSDFGDVTLLPIITLTLPAAEGATSVAGVLFNGQGAAQAPADYQVKALSGATTVATQTFLNVPPNTSSNGFVNFSVSSTLAQPITQLTVTTTSDISINGWDFFIDTITISSTSTAVPEPSSVLLVLVGLATIGYGARQKIEKGKG
jgi:hypothetical protein